MSFVSLASFVSSVSSSSSVSSVSSARSVSFASSVSSPSSVWLDHRNHIILIDNKTHRIEFTDFYLSCNFCEFCDFCDFCEFCEFCEFYYKFFLGNFEVILGYFRLF